MNAPIPTHAANGITMTAAGPLDKMFLLPGAVLPKTTAPTPVTLADAEALADRLFPPAAEVRNAIKAAADRVAVGDLNSNARGSGARKNAGKPDYSLVPLRLLMPTFEGTPDLFALMGVLAGWQEHTRAALEAMDRFVDLFGQPGVEATVRAFEYGACKYKAWNWAKGMPWSVPYACIVRHALAIARGADRDPESGCLHIGHIGANIVMLATYEQTYHEGDDRAPAGTLAPVPLDDWTDGPVNDPLDDGEWIEWRGGECPVPTDTRVGVRARDGGYVTGSAGLFGWSRSERDSCVDIVAYRVIA